MVLVFFSPDRRSGPWLWQVQRELGGLPVEVSSFFNVVFFFNLIKISNINQYSIGDNYSKI